ncbi:amidohydrolase family protein [Cellulomonas sp. RIT-PI-Y]|uniref:amidohydrolase family protein n=1 Tax=Cellulomonas sp. RIT-PI-Y TaxID=3035297 RepID=UPI0021D8F281|nr:amidohydrolase family protein [Cellulomonas sp. RIT-PI-Y]
MIIDLHGHIWNTQLDRTDEVVAQMDEVGLDRLCVLPIAPYMSNDDVAVLVAKQPDRFIGFASVVPFAQTTSIPRQDPIEELERAVTELGLRGLKLHPLIQGFSLADPGLAPVVQAAGRLGVPVLFHTGPSFGRNGRTDNGRVELIDDLAMMCPDTVIIAGHADPLGAAPYIAHKHPNVYLETSIAWPRYCKLIPGLARDAIDIATPEKILYGTDFSLGKQQRVRDLTAVLDGADLSDEEREMIEHGNAQRILGMP